MSYQDTHWLAESSYPFSNIQSVYPTAPAHWAIIWKQMIIKYTQMIIDKFNKMQMEYWNILKFQSNIY